MIDMFNSSENSSVLTLESHLLQSEGDDTKVWQILKAICLFLVNHGVWITVVFGCLGNALCLIVFARRKNVKPNDVFIITLAALDFAFCTANAVYYHMRSDVVAKTELDCAVENSLYHFLVPATCLTLMAITVDRYFAVFRIMEHRANVSNRKCLLCVAGIMGVTMVAIIPISFGCFLGTSLWMISYMYFVNLTLIMVAAVVILYVYCRIYFTVRQYDVLRQQMMSGQVTMETGGTQAPGQTTSNQEMIEMLPVQHKGSGRCSNRSDNYQHRSKQQMRNVVSPSVPYGCMPIRNNVADSPAVAKSDKPTTRVGKMQNVASKRNGDVVFRANGNCQNDHKAAADFGAVPRKGCSMTPVVNPFAGKQRSKGQNSQSGTGANAQPDGADKSALDLQRNIKRETKTTRVCVLVSFFFIAFCLPSAIIQVVWQVTPEDSNEDSFLNSTHFFLLLKLFYTLSTFNAIVNPIIYSISSARFKKELLAMYEDVTDAIAKGLRRFPCLQ